MVFKFLIQINQISKTFKKPKNLIFLFPDKKNTYKLLSHECDTSDVKNSERHGSGQLCVVTVTQARTPETRLRGKDGQNFQTDISREIRKSLT